MAPIIPTSPVVGTAASVRSHHISAIYPSRAEAEGMRCRLIDEGVAGGDIDIQQGAVNATDLPSPAPAGSNDILKEMLVKAVIGTVAGTGLGAVGMVALWYWGGTLFTASPLVAPLAMLGWFASVGGLVGAVVGAMRHGNWLTTFVHDAVDTGNTTLTARTRDARETARVKALIVPSLRGRDATVSDTI